MVYYVEDDERILELTLYTMRQAGIDAEGFPHSDAFFAACQRKLPDVVLLDIMLPGMDGLEILRILRSDPATKHLPIMMLTAKGAELDKAIGLDAGADDYLAKPFGMVELLARVRALMRRSRTPAVAPEERMALGPVMLDAASREALVDGKRLALTKKEFDLLRMLMANAGHVLSRAQLLEGVWGMAFPGGTRTVDVHVQTLRQKLGKAHAGADGLIATVRGSGYRVDAPDA